MGNYIPVYPKNRRRATTKIVRQKTKRISPNPAKTGSAFKKTAPHIKFPRKAAKKQKVDAVSIVSSPESQEAHTIKEVTSNPPHSKKNSVRLKIFISLAPRYRLARPRQSQMRKQAR